MDDQQPGGDSQGHWSAEAVCSQLPPPAGQGGLELDVPAGQGCAGQLCSSPRDPVSRALLPPALGQVEILDSAPSTVCAFHMEQSPGNINP